MKETGLQQLKALQRFTPALYTEKDGVWEGGSVSMFSSVLKFSLFERFSEEVLEVSESMEVNGKKTFGYDVPILIPQVVNPRPAPREWRRTPGMPPVNQVVADLGLRILDGDNRPAPWSPRPRN